MSHMCTCNKSQKSLTQCIGGVLAMDSTKLEHILGFRRTWIKSLKLQPLASIPGHVRNRMRSTVLPLSELILFYIIWMLQAIQVNYKRWRHRDINWSLVANPSPFDVGIEKNFEYPFTSIKTLWYFIHRGIRADKLMKKVKLSIGYTTYISINTAIPTKW